MGFTGVAAEPLMTDVYRIVARGNGYTSADKVQDFTLLKAAETTIAAGGNYFIVLSEADRTAIMSGQTPSTAQTNIIGHTAFHDGHTWCHLQRREAGRIHLSSGVAIEAGRTAAAGCVPCARSCQHNRSANEASVVNAWRTVAPPKLVPASPAARRQSRPSWIWSRSPMCAR
jgi:hypothetical protein